jgi:hypothetical protein
LTVHYTGRDADGWRYSGHRGHLDNAEAKGIAFGGIPVDEAISQARLEVVQPAAVEAAVLASQDITRERDEVLAA